MGYRARGSTELFFEQGGFVQRVVPDVAARIAEALRNGQVTGQRLLVFSGPFEQLRARVLHVLGELRSGEHRPSLLDPGQRLACPAALLDARDQARERAASESGA